MNLECCNSTMINRPKARCGIGVCCAAIFAIALTGCGEAKPDRVAVFPVKGTVTFKGQQMPGALVAFHPKTPLGDGVPTPRASIAKDGTFAVSTYDGNDGAPAGEYVLTFQWYKLLKNGGDVVAGPNVIPPKLGNPATSTATVTIVEGENNLPPIKL